MLSLPLLAVFAAAVAQAPADAPEKPKIIVLQLSAAGGVGEDVAGAVTEAITSQLAARGTFEVIGQREVQTLVSVERQKELLGCGENSSSCLSELAGALGARFVLSGTLAQIGTTYQLSLQTIDSQKAQTIGRATKIAPTLDQLYAVLPWALADATGTPPPERPSNVVSYSLALTGGLAVAAGATVGFITLTDESRIDQKLTVGESHPGVLESADYYRAEADRITLQKRIAIGAAVAGAALIVGGVIAYRPDPVGQVSMSLVPTGSGAAVVGVFP